MGKVSDLAEKLWRGESSDHPWMALQELEELERGIAFVSSFANVSAIDTDEGLVLVDAGSFLLAGEIHALVRSWSGRPLHTAVYTHGHIDHVAGVPVFEEEARTRGWAVPRVIAHEAVPARFDRYRRTAGWNGLVNARQFRMPNIGFDVQKAAVDKGIAKEFPLIIL